MENISTERLVGANTAGHATPDGGKKREKKRDKAENRTRADLERVLNGKMASSGRSLGGKGARDVWDYPSHLDIHQG